MLSGIKRVQVLSTREEVGCFLREIYQWAPLIPSYIEHTLSQDHQFTRTFRANLGVIQKTIALQVDIVEWFEPSKVHFELQGINESLEGSGSFELQDVASGTTNVTGGLDISGKGMMGFVINSMLKNYVPEMDNELTLEISKKLASHS